MQQRLAHFLAVTSFIVAVAYSAALAQRPVPPRDAAPSGIGAAQSHQAVLGKYCITCHNQRTKTGGLALDTLPLTDVRDHAEEWEKVVRKVRTGAMPPAGRAHPDKTSAEGLVTWLEAELDRAATERLNPGRPTLQRLNRNEYTNAVRDLLAVELDAASLLPADVAGYGFDNNADALTLSPALTERYLGAAAKIGQMLAFQADITRVSSFMMARENINRSYPEIGLPEAHHSMSHHGNNPDKMKAFAKLNTYHVETMTYFLKKLESIPDGDGSLLDHTVVLYGGGMSDGNTHNNYSVPVVMVGGGALNLKGNRHAK